MHSKRAKMSSQGQVTHLPGVSDHVQQAPSHADMLQAAKQGVKRIRVHTLTDGRDCEDGSSVKLMTQLVKELKEVSQGGVNAQVASGGGRMRVTMDRYEVRALLRVPEDWASHLDMRLV